MPRDYLKVEYDANRRPLTTYPELLAGYIARLSGMKPGDHLLEIGSGRAEVTRGFVALGLEVTAVDAAPSAETYAIEAGATFISAKIGEGGAGPLPIAGSSQDFIC